MTTSAEIHVGDAGTRFLVQVTDQDGNITDISSATSLVLTFQKPNGTEVSKTGTLFSDGTDGKLYYITDSTFLDIPGLWKIQAHIIYSSNSWYSNIGNFAVKPNL